MAARTEFRIHPSFGIARMGNSPDTYFLGPEDLMPFKPTLLSIPGKSGGGVANHFRDNNGRIARQAVRFRVFKYEYENVTDRYPTKVTQISPSQYTITWKIHIANVKSFSPSATNRLPNSPGPMTASSTYRLIHTGNAGEDLNPRLSLGGMFVDSDGCLRVLGSSGTGRKISGVSNAPNTTDDLHWFGWEDNAADGYVTATVAKGAGVAIPVDKDAWLAIGPPRYAPDVPHVVSLYEIALDRAIQAERQYTPTFKTADYAARADGDGAVRSLIDSYIALPAVSTLAKSHSSADVRDKALASIPASRRMVIKNRLTLPLRGLYTPEEHNFHGPIPEKGDITFRGLTQMPKQASSEFTNSKTLLTVTSEQYRWFSQWATPNNPAAELLSSNDVARLPRLLDKAQMRTACGGGFWPGIEVGNAAGSYRTWQADYGAERGHIDIRVIRKARTNPTAPAPLPGHFTSTLSVPWQVDFYQCAVLEGYSEEWWPASRPLESVRSVGGRQAWDLEISNYTTAHGGSAFQTMIDYWSRLGFIRWVQVGQSTELRDTERGAVP